MPAITVTIGAVKERQAVPSDVKELARSLYYQGVPREAIATQCGVKPCTIDTWRKRYSWTGNRKLSREIQSYSGPPDQQITITPQKPADTLRPQAYAYLKSIFPSLPKKLSRNPRDRKDDTTAINSYFNTVKLVEGWSDSPVPAVSIHILGQSPEEKYLPVTPISATDTTAPVAPLLPAISCDSDNSQAIVEPPVTPTVTQLLTPP